MSLHAEEFFIGIDVGSTTVKAVAMRGHKDDILWLDYQRHETHQAEKVHNFLQRMAGELPLGPHNTRVFFTGSGGASLAPSVGGHFVQEVNAVAMAVEKRHPQVQSVIELGGQDAKIVIFQEQPGSSVRRKIASMNDKCAGGTGAVLDKLSAKLAIPTHRLCEQTYRGIRLHPVAGKCGVFAETDITGLQKQGFPAEELMASLFEAIVLQNLTVLTRGHTLRPEVLLLGGPNMFIPGLREAWQEHIPRMWRERGVDVDPHKPVDELIRAPENGQYFAAIGAVEFGREAGPSAGRYRGLQALEELMRGGRKAEKLRTGAPGLRGDDLELRAFLHRYAPAAPKTFHFSHGTRVPVYLGVDGGSTSTKAVLLNEQAEVVARQYALSKGNPIQDTIGLLNGLRAEVERTGAQVEILGAATTGYAKDVLHKVLHADLALVETVAHARSAVHFYGHPDVIVDVGGQDIKLIVMKDGHVKDFMLNTQCSAGNGYFLQSTAESFGLNVSDYAERAFRAEVMPNFGYGCAVFLQSDIVNFQRQGWRADEILAGLAAVLPKNIWLYVARIPNLPALGRFFVLQGGTQRNLAAVKAQVDYIRQRFRGSGVDPEIVVHEHCGEAGAIGAALEVRRLHQQGMRTRFPGLDAVSRITYSTSTGEETRCGYCRNNCLRTFIDFQVAGMGKHASERLIVATCERGAAESTDSLRTIQARLQATRKQNPNLVDRAARGVWKAPDVEVVADRIPARAWTPAQRRRAEAMRSRATLRLGIPRVLNLYVIAPFFAGYFQSLGIPAANLVYSDFTNDEMYREGAKRGAIDPCFPSKVVLAHVHNLLYTHHARKPLHVIFAPMVDALESPLKNVIATNACPTVIATPESAKAAFTKETDLFAERGIRYLNPLLNFADRALLERQMMEAFGELLGLSPEENRRALEQGHAAQQRWTRQLRREARETLEMLEREGRLGILLLGRSYQHDPGINHGIPEEFQKLGYPVFSQSTLPLDDEALLERLFGDEVRAGLISHPLDISDVWKHSYSASTNHKVFAAKFAARHPNLVAVELSSFKCGHDAPAYTVIQRIIEYAGRPYFSFKDLDENKPAGAMKIRIQTIDYFLRRHRQEVLTSRIAPGDSERRLEEYERAAAAGA